MFVLIAAGSLIPAREIPTPAIDGLDKIQHLLGYAVLSGYAVLLFATPQARWRAAGFVIVFGLGIEAAQSALTTSRQADVLDVLANAAGAVLGQMLAYSRFADVLAQRR